MRNRTNYTFIRGIYNGFATRALPVAINVEFNLGIVHYDGLISGRPPLRESRALDSWILPYPKGARPHEAKQAISGQTVFPAHG